MSAFSELFFLQAFRIHNKFFYMLQDELVSYFKYKFRTILKHGINTTVSHICAYFFIKSKSDSRDITEMQTYFPNLD